MSDERKVYSSIHELYSLPKGREPEDDDEVEEYQRHKADEQGYRYASSVDDFLAQGQGKSSAEEAHAYRRQRAASKGYNYASSMTELLPSRLGRREASTSPGAVSFDSVSNINNFAQDVAHMSPGKYSTGHGYNMPTTVSETPYNRQAVRSPIGQVLTESDSGFLQSLVQQVESQFEQVESQFEQVDTQLREGQAPPRALGASPQPLALPAESVEEEAPVYADTPDYQSYQDPAVAQLRVAFAVDMPHEAAKATRSKTAFVGMLPLHQLLELFRRPPEVLGNAHGMSPTYLGQENVPDFFMTGMLNLETGEIVYGDEAKEAPRAMWIAQELAQEDL